MISEASMLPSQHHSARLQSFSSSFRSFMHFQCYSLPRLRWCCLSSQLVPLNESKRKVMSQLHLPWLECYLTLLYQGVVQPVQLSMTYMLCRFLPYIHTNCSFISQCLQSFLCFRYILSFLCICLVYKSLLCSLWC